MFFCRVNKYYDKTDSDHRYISGSCSVGHISCSLVIPINRQRQSYCFSDVYFYVVLILSKWITWSIFASWLFNRTLSIYNRGRYSISNINQLLTICQQMLKICINIFFFWNVVRKIGAIIVSSLSFNLAVLNWPKEQSTDSCGLDQFNNCCYVLLCWC